MATTIRTIIRKYIFATRVFIPFLAFLLCANATKAAGKKWTEKLEDVIIEEPTALNPQYNGKEQDIVTKGVVKEGYSLYFIISDNYDVSSYEKKKDVKTYEVKYYVMDNNPHSLDDLENWHSDTVPLTASIVKAQIAYSPEPKANDGLEYNGKKQSLLTAGKVIPEELEIKIMYSGNAGATWETSLYYSGLNAATYKYLYKVEGDDNYEGIEERELTVIIAQADVEFTSPTGKENLRMDDAEVETVALINEGVATGKDDLNGNYYEYSLDGENWEKEVPTANKIGEYTVKYRLVTDKNHKGEDNGEISVKVKRKKPLITARPDTVGGLVYNATAQTLIKEGEVEDGIMTYSLDKETWTEDAPTATNASDSICVFYRVVSDDPDSNYEQIDSIKASIAKAEIPDDDVFPANPQTSLVYNEGLQSLLSGPCKSRNNLGTPCYAIGAKEEADDTKFLPEPPEGMNAGIYNICYKVKGDANHLDSKVFELTVEIAKAKADLKAIAIDTERDTLVYNSDTLYNADDFGVVMDPTVKYLFSLDAEVWAEEWPNLSDAGDYTVYYKVKGGEDINHGDSDTASLVVTIGKAEAVLDTLPEAVWGLVSGGEESELVVPGVVIGGEFEYSLDNVNWSSKLPKSNQQKTHAVYYRVKCDANHKSIVTDSIIVVVDTFLFDNVAQDMKMPTFVGDTMVVLNLGKEVRVDNAYIIPPKESETTILEGLEIVQNKGTLEIKVPADKVIPPGLHKGTLVLRNGNDTIHKEIEIKVNYPSYRIIGLWDDVVAVDCLNSDIPSETAKLAGAQFHTFQWYMDGELVKNATKSYLYIEGGYAGHEFYCVVDMGLKVGPMRFDATDEPSLRAWGGNGNIYISVKNAKEKESVVIVSEKGVMDGIVAVGVSQVQYTPKGAGVYVVYMQRQGKKQALKVLVSK